MFEEHCHHDISCEVMVVLLWQQVQYMCTCTCIYALATRGMRERRRGRGGGGGGGQEIKQRHRHHAAGLNKERVEGKGSPSMLYSPTLGTIAHTHT